MAAPLLLLLIGTIAPKPILFRLPAATANPIPDVFSARFVTTVRHAVASAPRQPRGRVFVSEEGARWNSLRGPSLLEQFLAMPRDAPGRHRAERFLEEQGDSDATLSEREKDRFAEMVAFNYFSAWKSAVRAADPRGRFTGGRFTSRPPEPVLRGIRRALGSPEQAGPSP